MTSQTSIFQKSICGNSIVVGNYFDHCVKIMMIFPNNDFVNERQLCVIILNKAII